MPKQVVPLRGGLNTNSDRSLVRPGQMTRCLNFEVTKGGVVRRALGYRRWSGGCWYGAPSFFMWGPYDSGFDQGAAVWGQWGLPGGQFERNETNTWVDYGRLAPYVGRGRLTYHYEFFGKAPNYQTAGSPTTSGIVVVGLQGRELIRPERVTHTLGYLSNETINQTFGIDATWPTVADDTVGTTAFAAHQIMERAWPAYWDQVAGEGLAANDTLGDAGGVGSIPGYHPFGGIAGLTYWRDRLYVAADILSFTFADGVEPPAVGSVVELTYGTPGEATGWKWTVEKVIVTGGEWANGDVTGTILLIGGVSGAPTNAYPAMFTSGEWSSGGGRLLDDGSEFTSVVPDVPYLRNVTTGTEGVMRLVGYADPIEDGAALWRSIDLFDVPNTLAWERVDLGYEVAFKDGDNAFLVVNRISSDAYLDGGTGNPTILDTGWVFPGTLKVGSSLQDPSSVQEDDGVYLPISSSFVITPPNPALSPKVIVSGFDFNVPEYSIITGIEVEINVFDTGAIVSGYGPYAFNISLAVDEETFYGNKAPGGSIPAVSTNIYTLGGQSDLWGAPLSPAAVNDPNFGIALTFANGQVNIDYVKVKVHYKPYVSTIYFRDPADVAKSVTDMTVSVLVQALSTVGEIQGAIAGDTVTIAGATPAAYNGAVVLFDPTGMYEPSSIGRYYLIAGLPFPATPATGTITLQTGVKSVTITRPTGNTAFIDFGGPHNITQSFGYTMTISGATPAAYNGTGLSFSIVNANTLSYTVAGLPSSPATGAPSFQLAAQGITLARAPDSPAVVWAEVVDHGYLPGQHATIADVTEADFNGTFQVYPDPDNATDAFRYAISPDPSAGPTIKGETAATRTSVSSASAVWYYKDKGDWSTTPSGDARGILTIYDVQIPGSIGAGQQIRSDPAGAGTLYALTAGAAERVYLQSSKDLARNHSQYEWLIANFTRSVVFEQLFGCNGAGTAFSFDGKYFIRIRTGLSKALDRPRHLIEHNFQLALGYDFGDVAFSDLGYGESFSAVFDGSSPASLNPDFAGGSTTVSVADPVRGLLRLPEQSMAVFCEHSVRRISGSGGVFGEQVVRAGHGILEYTARNVNGLVMFTDTLGIARLRPTEFFGQLLPQYISANITGFLEEHELSSLSGPRPSAMFAMPFNNRNQYRLFFNDGSYIAVTMVGAEMDPQFWVGQYDFVPSCVGIGVHSDRSQVQFAGHVYRANYLIPFTPGPGGAGSTISGSTYSPLEVNPAWPFQLDVSSTWDGDPMPALATFFMGDMAEQAGLQTDKRFGHVVTDVRAYGYASMAYVFSSREGNPVALRVKSTDFVGATQGLPGSVGKRLDGDYLSMQQYRRGINSNCSGEWLMMTVESNGSRDYEAGQDDAGVRWLRPFELGVAVVYFDLNKNAVASETSGS